MGWQGIASLGFGLLGNAQSTKGQIEAQKAQAQEIIRKYNYSLQDIGMQRADATDSAINEVQQVRTNALGLVSGVDAALSENYGEGRTAAQLSRAANADTLRASESIRDNLLRRYSEFDANQDRAYLNAKIGVENANSSIKAIEKSSRLGILSTLVQHGIAAKVAQSEARTKGLNWSVLKGTYSKPLEQGLSKSNNSFSVMSWSPSIGTSSPWFSNSVQSGWQMPNSNAPANPYSAWGSFVGGGSNGW